MKKKFEKNGDFVKSTLGSAVGVLHVSTFDLLCELTEIHKEIWKLENQARSLVSDSFIIADTKRSIDSLNAKRHNLVDTIDRTIIQTPQMPTVFYSETPGELSDRLLVVALKIIANSEIVVDSSIPEEYQKDSSGRLSALHTWRQHLQRCLLLELEDIAMGQASVPPRAEFKLYNEMLNPVLRAERQHLTDKAKCETDVY